MASRSSISTSSSDVADHCTVLPQVLKPCPVDIDFGDVSIAMRNFLHEQGEKKFVQVLN